MYIKLKWQAWKALWQRYSTVFSFYWQERDKITHKAKTKDEAEFLPSALAIEHQPVSPMGRGVAYLIMLLIIIAVLWAIFGKIDIVVNGAGKLIPQEYSKTVASVETARIVELPVFEGQQVKQGDLLIALDTRMTESDHQKAIEDHQLSWLQIQRTEALLSAIENNKTPSLPSSEDINEGYFFREKQHLNAQWQDFQAKKKRLESQIQRYQAQLPLAEKRAQDYKSLLINKDVSEHAWLEKQLAFLDIQGQLSDAKTQLQTLISETKKLAQEEQQQATRTWSESKQDIHKASAHTDQLKLLAPVDGTVQQLSVHTVGGVVNAGEPLMTIVPKNSKVEFEGFIENKDIGFIHEGQKVQIKIDTFEYTKYGIIPAIVKHISQDAIDPTGNSAMYNLGKNDSSEKTSKPLVYSVRANLDATSININGKQIDLTAGMSGSIEILTGERRVIEYLISPLITHTTESMRER